MKSLLAIAIVGYLWLAAPAEPHWLRPMLALAFGVVVLLVFLN